MATIQIARETWIRDTKDTVRYRYYRQDTGEIQTGDPKNTRQGRATTGQNCAEMHRRRTHCALLRTA